MNKLIEKAGLGVGILGVLMMAGAGIWRVTGHYRLAGFDVMTLFVGGMGVTLIGCFALLYLRRVTRA